jgi:DNA-binding CsgD family transcriptional regulator
VGALAIDFDLRQPVAERAEPGPELSPAEPATGQPVAFESLGAVPWMDRARAELHATGETVPRREGPALRELTPQELQVALLVGKGATNREAGAALFLSPKTVEAHLGRIYRKLGVRSRTELAALVASDETLAEAATVS